MLHLNNRNLFGTKKKRAIKLLKNEGNLNAYYCIKEANLTPTSIFWERQSHGESEKINHFQGLGRGDKQAQLRGCQDPQKVKSHE